MKMGKEEDKPLETCEDFASRISHLMSKKPVFLLFGSG
jgi:hypothetical protein